MLKRKQNTKFPVFNFAMHEHFLEAYFVVNDLSDIVFFKKRFMTHMDVFSLRNPSFRPGGEIS